VRCGKCHKVFNALDYLLDEEPIPYFPPIQANMAPDSAPLTPLRPPFAEPQSTTFVEPLFAEPQPHAEPQLPAFDEPDTTSPPDPIIDPVIDMVEMIDVSAITNVAPLSAPPAVDPIDAALAEQEADAASQAEISRLSPEAVKQRGREAGLVAARSRTEVPGYSLWSDGALGTPARTYALWPFVVASVVLALLLAAQLVYRYRGELAMDSPGIQNAYTAFGIEIPLPRDPDRISIDASELQAVTVGDSDDPAAYSGHLQLVATLKNQAPHPQGWPHLEIALTDAYDAILTRKVFKPGEYLPADAPPAFASGETPVTLDLSVGELKPNGYRLNLLYP
jgi:hypothetical protein